MSDPIDYSRPVGWWCPVCTRVSMGDYLLQAIRLNRRCLDTDEARQRRLHMVPVYLPIPEGQRPPAASEADEAEVVTWCGSGDASDMYAWRGASGAVVGPLTLNKNQTTVINYIVTGAAE